MSQPPGTAPGRAAHPDDTEGGRAAEAGGRPADVDADAAAEEDAARAQAVSLFGDTFATAQRYADLLATRGVDHGMIGPREGTRLWTRHLVASALLSPLVPADVSVVDIGSGAGLPGLPLALARPDVRVTLLEPLARRITFLRDVVAELALPNVEVARGRIEASSTPRWDTGVCRAVAPLHRLIPTALPALCSRLIAVKGARASAEIEQAVALVSPELRWEAELVTVPGPAGGVRAVVVTPQRGRREPGPRRS